MIFNTGGSNATSKRNGTDIYITDSTEGRIKGLIVRGNSVQTGTPTPDSPKDIKSVELTEVTACGKNLLDCNGLVAQTINGVTFTPVYEDGLLKYINVNGTATDRANYDLNKRFSLKAGTYTYNGISGGSNSTYVIHVLSLTSVTDGNKNFTLPENKTDLYTYVSVYAGTVCNNLKFYPMIRLAEVTDGTYEPYTASTVSLSEAIPLDGLNGARDFIDKEKGVKVQKFKLLRLSSDMEWIHTSNSGLWVYSSNVTDFKLVEENATGDKTYGNAICNIATHSKTFNADEYAFSLWYAHGSYTGYRLAFRNEYTTDADTWKAYLDSHEVYILYELAEPIETPLTSAQLLELSGLRTYEGATRVTNNAGADMAVEYFLNNNLGKNMAKVPHTRLDGTTLYVEV